MTIRYRLDRSAWCLSNMGIVSIHFDYKGRGAVLTGILEGGILLIWEMEARGNRFAPDDAGAAFSLSLLRGAGILERLARAGFLGGTVFAASIFCTCECVCV